MKTTVLADYKAKTSTGSRIHVAHNDLPLQVNQMIVWMMNYPAMAMGMIPRWSELKADQKVFADHAAMANVGAKLRDGSGEAAVGTSA